VARQDQSIIRSSYADACQTLAVCVAINRALATRGLVAVERAT